MARDLIALAVFEADVSAKQGIKEIPGCLSEDKTHVLVIAEK